MPGFLPPTGPRNPSMSYGGGGAQSTVPGYPTMQGGGGTDAMITALLNAPRGQQQQGPGVRAANALEAAPRQAAPNPEQHRGGSWSGRGGGASLDDQLKAVALAKAKKEGEVWLQNGPYGLQKVSPGTPGAFLSQSSGY